MGVSKVSFPRRLQLQNRDSTRANLSNAIKCRCRGKDYEELPSTSETFVYVAMTRLMLKRLAA
jgi:hypothetical protein